MEHVALLCRQSAWVLDWQHLGLKSPVSHMGAIHNWWSSQAQREKGAEQPQHSLQGTHASWPLTATAINTYLLYIHTCILHTCRTIIFTLQTTQENQLEGLHFKWSYTHKYPSQTDTYTGTHAPNCTHIVKWFHTGPASYYKKKI